MTDYSWPVQQAVYAALTAAITDVTITDAATDAPADAAGFPYIEIGGGQTIPDDTSVADGGISEFIDLHVWSRYRGNKQAKELIARLYDALHGVSLTVSGRASALAWVRTSRILDDPDGVTRHGIVSVEIIHRS